MPDYSLLPTKGREKYGQIDSEQWAAIPGVPHYEASDYGRVRRSSRGRGAQYLLVLSPRPTRRGYQTVRLRYEGRYRTFFIHKLVLLAFVGPRPDGHQCNHRNGRKEDNRLTNLEWVTGRENMAHSWAMGLHRIRVGSESSAAKLTEEQVRAIRQSRATNRAVAREFGVTSSCINCIRTGQTWKHVA